MNSPCISIGSMTIGSCQIGKCSSDRWVSYIAIYRRDEIINILKNHYAERNGINLPIFGVDKANLTEFTTNERDKKRG